MKIVIPGGSGQVGTILARAFHAEGHEVVILSRHPCGQPWRVVAWDGVSLGAWQSEIDGCDAVINLTGRSVNCRYTAGNRDQILQSRVLSTRVVGHAIASASLPPRVWLQASTASRCLRRTVRPGVARVDARDRCAVHAHRNRAHSQKPARRAGEVAREWIHLPIS